MRGSWVLTFACALFGAALVSCSELRSQGEQCVFNDDCVDPLVCAGRRCRAQCRSGRDCGPGAVCIPSENPLRTVCVPSQEPSICSGDGQCPGAALCLDHACWWTCGAPPECAARGAGVCQLPPGLCASPVSAQAQADTPRPLFVRPSAAAPDAAAPDGATVPDVPPPDAPSSPDVAPQDAAPMDGPPADVASIDAPADLAPMDAPAVDAPAVDAPAVDGPADVAREPGALSCSDGADCALPNATGRCASGLCAVASCTSGFTDCNRQPSDGCEVRTGSDVMNCGACGARCAAQAHTTVGCASGMCVPLACAAGFGDCDGDPANGCEVDFTTNNRHCGGCGQTCFRSNVAAAGCAAGGCIVTACAPGWGDCDRTGAPSPVAAPTPEFANGCETAVDTDARHCGACGARCDPTRGRCERGACVSDAPLGWVSAPTSPLRELTLVAIPGMVPTVVTVESGTYNLERLLVPAGVELRASGSGFLDLRVLGEARVEGTINLSGGDGGDSVPSADPTRRAGGGGGTGTVAHGSPSSAAPCEQMGGGGGSVGAPGQWAPGDRACGGPGRLGGGAGGVVGLGGSGGGGLQGAGGGAGSVSGGGAGSVATIAGGSSGVTRGGEGGTTYTTSVNYNGRRGGTCSIGAAGVGGGGGGAIGNDAAVDDKATTVIATGSGGGGGGGFSGSPGAGGGGGGGVVRIVSATQIVVLGRILAEGGRGGAVRANTDSAGGAGGGGSGGLVSLVAPFVQVDPAATISSRGGDGGAVTFEGVSGTCTAPGGAGGFGRTVIRTRCATWVRQGTILPMPRACAPASAINLGATAEGVVVEYP